MILPFEAALQRLPISVRFRRDALSTSASSIAALSIAVARASGIMRIDDKSVLARRNPLTGT